MKKEICPILVFSKVMAFIIVCLASVNIVSVYAAGPINMDSIKASLIEWILGLVAASATVIAGYVASALKTAIKYFYDAVRAKIANTVIGEIIDDIDTFANNSVDIFEAKLGAALANDGKIDQKEINEIVDAMYNNAVAVWGTKKIDYLGKYKENAIAWVKAKFEEKVREWIEGFRWTKSRSNIVSSQSN